MDYDKAALEAHAALLDYSDVTALVRALRQHPLGIPFATYSLKIGQQIVRKFASDIKNTKNAVLKADTFADKALAAWAHTHFTRKFVAWKIVLSSAPAYMASAMLGLDGDDWEKLKEAALEWVRSKHVLLPMPFVDGSGKVTLIDLSRMYPYDPHINMAKAVSDSYREPKKLLASIGAFSGPFPQLLSVWATGIDPFTKREINPKYLELSDSEQWARSLNWTVNMITPSWADGLLVEALSATTMPGLSRTADGNRFIAAATGRTDRRTGKIKTTPLQAAASLMGGSVINFDPQETRGVQIDNKEKAIGRVSAEIIKVTRDNKISESQRSRRLEDLREYRSRLQKDLKDYIKQSDIKLKRNP